MDKVQHKEEPNPSAEELALNGIAEALQSYPLYRAYKYSATLRRERLGGMTGTQRFVYLPLPADLEMHCPRCKKEQRWTSSEHDRAVYVDRDREAKRIKYSCKNCESQAVEYFFYWRELDGKGTFFKVGQYPALQNDPPRDLKLPEDDVELYRRALTSRNVSYGIGALAYLRRVVENQMNALLDLLLDTMKASGDVDEGTPAEFERVRRTGGYEDKAKFAASVIPRHLRPGGHNPFNELVGLSSRGLHSESEEECLAIFDKVRGTFEYLFRNLTTTTEDAKAYIESLSNLAGGGKGKRKL